MTRRLLFLILALSSYALSFGQLPGEEALVRAMHTITSKDLMDYVIKQCDDKYEGRLTGTPGYQQCADWIAGEMKGWGVQPGGENGSWFQWFTIPCTLVDPDCGLSLKVVQKDGSSISKNYKYVSEYFPGSTSGSGEITGEVVYAGYGISAPELGYDDYAGIDVKGKIILIERESPVGPNAGADKFNPWYEYSFHQYKLQNAVKHGAAGMLYNYGPLANPNNAYDRNFIYVHIGDSVIKDVFAGTGKDHRTILEKINSTLKPQSFNTKKTVTIRMATRHFPDGKGSNLIGVIKGSDPVLSNEAIIIGAHIDHLGKCYEIMPGANDNASAVAVMMGIAKAISTNMIQLKRTIIFIGFGSEEQALVGSRTYVSRPLMPLEKSVLLNMDGVGAGTSYSASAGRDFPALWSFIDNANKDYVHRVVMPNSFPNLGRPRLDAAIFLKAGVPSISFGSFGGAPAPYHVPADDVDIINPEMMEDLAQMLFIAAVRMANSDKPLR